MYNSRYAILQNKNRILLLVQIRDFSLLYYQEKIQIIMHPIFSIAKNCITIRIIK